MTGPKSNGVGATHSRVQSNFPLEELSWKITKDASIVSQYLAGNHLQQPSCDVDGPSVIITSESPQYVRESRQRLIASAIELMHLAIGPSEFLPHLATGYRIFHLVPLTGSISYHELAVKAQVPEQRIKSVARMAMTTSLFQETQEGHIAHTANSVLLARNPDVYAYATYMSSRSAPMAMALPAAAARFGPDSMRTHETAYNVAFDTDLPFFDHIGRDKTRMGEFAAYMRNMRSSEAVDIKHLIAGYAWQSIRDGGTVVDVGGSIGGTAIALAQAFPHLNFVVQDLAENADKGKAAAASLPADIQSRIKFQGHTFFDPEPVRGAEIYLLRMILHDWPDDDAIKIIKNLTAAMESGSQSRLLIMDTVLPRPGSVPVSIERIMRARDLTMLQAFNSKERDMVDWEALLAASCPDLKLIQVSQPYGSAMSILEIAKAPVGNGTKA